MALQIRKSNPNKPPRVVIYGREGVGKSTFGAKAKKPVFISPEGGIDQLTDSEGNPIEEIIGINSWDSLRGAIAALANDKHEFETLVLDTADWIEGLCHKKIIGNSKHDIIRVNGGYSAGLRESEKLHRELLEDLSVLREKRNMMIIVTAHTNPKDAKDPEAEPYDCFQLKMDWRVGDLWKEWSDAMLFVRFRTFVKKDDDGNSRAFDDSSRVAYTTAKAAAHAKNRYGLPAEMEFTPNFFNEFMKYAIKGIQAETAEQIRNEIVILHSQLTDEEIKKKVAEHLEKVGNNISDLNNIRSRLKTILGGK